MAGEPAVEGMAEAEAGFGSDGVGEVGAGGGGGGEGLKHAAVEEGGEGRVEEDGDGAGGLLEEEAVGEGFRRATAEGEDGVGAGECAGECAGLEPAEMRLAEGGEDLGDGDAGEIGNEVVEIEEGPAEMRGEVAADGGLAGAHEAGEDDTGDGEGQGGGCRFCGLEGLGGHGGLRWRAKQNRDPGRVAAVEERVSLRVRSRDTNLPQPLDTTSSR